MDLLSWRHFRNFPGQGDLPLDDFMDALNATGFEGLFSLEIFNDQFRGGLTRRVAVDGYRSLVYLLDRMRDRLHRPVNELPAMPPRARCLGVEFIEFAVDDQSALTLERMLAGLGFRRTGEHISKAVTRWCQGNINVVVNREKEGFAHSYNITHGAAVCAIGLRVDEAAAALDRAQLLFDTPFRQAVGPGELEVPAVRGLGGSLIYFLDSKSDLGRVWDIEFQPVSDGQANGLKSIDHAQSCSTARC
jgi:4-hydroxyphenylpyruvate dioxygenase